MGGTEKNELPIKDSNIWDDFDVNKVTNITESN